MYFYELSLNRATKKNNNNFLSSIYFQLATQQINTRKTSDLTFSIEHHFKRNSTIRQHLHNSIRRILYLNYIFKLTNYSFTMDNIKNFIGNVITTNKTSLQTSSAGGEMSGRKRSESLCSNASDVSNASDGRKMERKDSKDNEPYFYIM